MIDKVEVMHVVLVTGPSGAGRTTAINFLEDAGFEAIDNVPLTLAPRLFDGSTLNRPLALGLDTRNRDFSINQMMDTIDELASNDKLKVEVLYLDCTVDMLIQRFSEARRRHHLSPDGVALAGILTDLELMQAARTRADILIDTTKLSPQQLHTQITKYFMLGSTKKLAISVQSFSYRRGVPREVDMMFDCRFLRNPHWQKDLRDETGLHSDVQAFVSSDKNFLKFRNKILGLAELVIPAHQAEGRSYLSIGFGCTGGKHRSVTVAEIFRNDLQLNGWHVTIRHRELMVQSAQ